MHNSWLVILPPVLVLLLAFSTHRVVLSLILGIASASLIFNDFSIIPATKTFFIRLWETIELGNFFSWQAFVGSSTLFLYLFLLFLGVIIALMTHAGGTQAYARFVEKRLHNQKSAETSSVILSSLFFVDEYLSILMVGSVMKPVTDRFLIPRAKLAFLVSAMAAPLCIIAPLSSWCAFIFIQLDRSGVIATPSSETLIISTPFQLFIKTIPFAFYSFIIIASVFFIIHKRISYGAMHKHEQTAQKTKNLFGGKPERVKQSKNVLSENNASLFSFLFPILTLVITVFVVLFFTNFVAPPALFIGATCSLIVSIIFFLATKKLSFKQLPAIFWEGIEFTIPALIIVTLALTFSEILKTDLLTGQFLASQLTGVLNLTLFPLIFFVATIITTLGIGSAWGAMSIMVPIAIPMLVSIQ
ncbi:hypothetical protein KAT92_05015, partial [Candidatus Babeliales bacterium]|nr:hypothetical protein [Candidatus Babeliales bacterium]